MKRNKITALLLSLFISLSLMKISVFGAEIDSKNFEQAILNVKSVIPISDVYNNFSHSSRQIDNGKDTVTVWNLEWEADEENRGYISAEVDSYGNLCNYNNYSYNYDSSGLVKISREEARSTAEDFLKKALPDYLSDMRLIEKENSDFYSNQYNFKFQQYVNDIPVNFMKVNVCINKYTGEVDFYSGLEPGTKKSLFPEVDSIMDIESAKSKYIENIQEDLSYHSYCDYKLKKNNTFAGYSLNNNKAIDAKNGQAITIFNSVRNIYSNKSSLDSAGAESDKSGTGTELNEVEKEEVNNISGLISKEKAQEIIEDNIELFSKMQTEEISLNKSYMGNNYIWQLKFDNGSAEVNATTGEILAFYIYKSIVGGENNSITEEAAKIKSEDLLNKIARSKFNQTKLRNDYIDEDNSSYDFEYIRQVDGKNYTSNRLSVLIDKDTGTITSYNNIWYDDLDLPDISQAISKYDAFNKFNEIENFGLYYALDENEAVKLVYNFSEDEGKYYIDALSGKNIDGYGNEYKSNEIPEYDDIKGHWCEKIVKELLDSGYYIQADKFNPDINISQINFFRYMLSPDLHNYSEDEIYNMLIDRGIIKKEERNASSSVTNKDVAKFIARYLGYDKLAQNSNIFNNQFNDSIDDKYLGYANICYALNIIKGDSQGNFNADKYVTNAMASVYIYNILSQNNSIYIK